MRPNELLVHVRVLARGSRSEIQGVRNGRLQIKTTSPPVGGAANDDVIRQLARAFGVPPSRVLLHRGTKQRIKSFRILAPRRMPDYVKDLAPR
ncbi:MAG: DUF167 domain-containing protein [Woeseia sp.]